MRIAVSMELSFVSGLHRSPPRPSIQRRLPLTLCELGHRVPDTESKHPCATSRNGAKPRRRAAPPPPKCARGCDGRVQGRRQRRAIVRRVAEPLPIAVLVSGHGHQPAGAARHRARARGADRRCRLERRRRARARARGRARRAERRVRARRLSPTARRATRRSPTGCTSAARGWSCSPATWSCSAAPSSRAFPAR